jgi:hypothetical protein
VGLVAFGGQALGAHEGGEGDLGGQFTVHPLPDLALAPRHYRLMTIRTPERSPLMARIRADCRIPALGCP